MSSDRDCSVRWALAISGVILVSAYCWLHRVEFYPLTAWHLYSGSDTSGKITYRKVLARYESGTTAPARLEDTIGALALDQRYTPFLEKCFGQPSDISMCTKFLSVAGSVYNRKVPAGERITHYEIQLWTWDFGADPVDPQHGRVVKRLVHRIGDGRDLSPDDYSAAEP